MNIENARLETEHGLVLSPQQIAHLALFFGFEENKLVMVHGVCPCHERLHVTAEKADGSTRAVWVFPATTDDEEGVPYWSSIIPPGGSANLPEEPEQADDLRELIVNVRKSATMVAVDDSVVEGEDVDLGELRKAVSAAFPNAAVVSKDAAEKMLSNMGSDPTLN
jgi:hypothetical protein